MLIALPEGRTAEHVRPALARRIRTLPVQLRRTLTWDRGTWLCWTIPRQPSMPSLASTRSSTLPLGEQPGFLRSIARWLRPGGALIATVGHGAWTGAEKDWLGVPGGDMWWDHADAATYRRWLADAGFVLEVERFVPEGIGGHTFVLASR